MRVALLPALAIQRRLYTTPPGMGRFREYIDELRAGTSDVRLPIGEFNPMGKEHAVPCLDAWIRLDAEGAVLKAGRDAARRLQAIDDELHLSVVMADDAGGGWTDRDRIDARWRFEDKGRVERGFATVHIWSTEPPDVRPLAQRVHASIYRTAFQRRFGLPETLAQRMRQEGLVARFIGLDAQPTDAEIALVRAHEDDDDFATSFALFYGDEAARRQGMKPLGAKPGAATRVARRLAGDPVAAISV